MLMILLKLLLWTKKNKTPYIIYIIFVCIKDSKKREKIKQEKILTYSKIAEKVI